MYLYKCLADLIKYCLNFEFLTDRVITLTFICNIQEAVRLLLFLDRQYTLQGLIFSDYCITLKNNQFVTLIFTLN